MKKSILITGPQGCGKTRLAIKLAERDGSYCVVDEAQLQQSPFNEFLARAMTVVVDECTNLACMKALISNDSVVIHEKGKATWTVPTPNFIFVTGDPNPVKEDGRRFIVIDLAGA